MTTRVETPNGLRSATTAPRRSARLDVAVSAVGVLVYSFVIWLLIFALLPMLVGMKPTVVASGSMQPLLREGDVVLTSDHPGTGLGVGTVIVFKTEGSDSSVMHRIASVEPDGSYRTRGDANATIDSTPVWPDDIMGVARLLVPYAGLPAHWLRVGSWPHLVGFVVLITAATTMARRRPRSRARRFGRDGSESAVGEGLVPINEAGIADLERLPGVGPVLAQRIDAHRTSQGPFTIVEDLLDVPGIGAHRLAALRDAVRVS